MTTTVNNSLNTLLADFQVFYQKLRNYHWNVSGPNFFGLHAKFEELYNQAAEQIDEIAERILARGERPASTLKAYLSMASIQEDDGVPKAGDMVRNIQSDIAKLIESMREAVDRAHAENDPATANLLEQYADEYEKTAWMFKAYLS